MPRVRSLTLRGCFSRQSLNDILRLDGGRFIFAGLTSLGVGVLIHPHLCAALLPVSACLCVVGIVSIGKDRKRRDFFVPLRKAPRAQGLDAWQRSRLSKSKTRQSDA